MYQAKGRWYDALLCRWYEGNLQAIGGWALLKTASGIGASVRKLYTWGATATPLQRIALATHNKIFTITAGSLNDVTPSGYTAGAEDATTTAFSPVEANTVQFDSMPDGDLIACAWRDGKIYEQQIADSTAAMTVVTNAPTSCDSAFVTIEGFLTALGAGGDPRKIAWADVDDRTDWSAGVSDQAGDYPVPMQGTLQRGMRGKGENLIWTSTELWSMRYIGAPIVYSFSKKGDNCGPASRNSMVVIDGKAVWMGNNNFFSYDGFVKPIPSEVGEYVFNDIDRQQISKVNADVRSDFHEVWWYYPSLSGSGECDRAVIWDYVYNTWNVTNYRRTAGCDRGVYPYPLAADETGAIYEHEKATTYVDEDSTAYVPYATTGPIEIAEGDSVMVIQHVIPDEATVGQMNLTIYGSFYPGESETTYGPYTLQALTDVRITARQIRLKFTQTTAGWRSGLHRLSGVLGGGR